MERSALAKLQAENVQPAYAEGFGVAGAHLSRRSGSEGGTSNPPSPRTGSAVASAQLRKNSRACGSIADKSVQEILAILHKWGIHTLGQLAALDQEQLGERLGPEAVRLWERANGRSNRLLKFVQLPESFDESFEFEHEIETTEPLLFMLRRFLEQLALRLSAIYLVAKEINLRITFANKEHYERRFKIPQPTNDVDLLFRMLHTHLENFKSEHPIIAVSLDAQPIKPVSQQFGLFETALKNPQQLYETLARLTALLGTDHAGTPVLEDTHRPDAFRIEPFVWKLNADEFPHYRGSARAPLPEGEGRVRVATCSAPSRVALRRFRPVASASVLLCENVAAHIRSANISGKVVDERGPYLASGNWWDENAWAHTEWDLQLEDGALCRGHRTGETWEVAGVYD
jgi:protein ImuB